MVENCAVLVGRGIREAGMGGGELLGGEVAVLVGVRDLEEVLHRLLDVVAAGLAHLQLRNVDEAVLVRVQIRERLALLLVRALLLHVLDLEELFLCELPVAVLVLDPEALGGLDGQDLFVEDGEEEGTRLVRTEEAVAVEVGGPVLFGLELLVLLCLLLVVAGLHSRREVLRQGELAILVCVQVRKHLREPGEARVADEQPMLDELRKRDLPVAVLVELAVQVPQVGLRQQDLPILEVLALLRLIL
mmetsp:Transcript_98431/g.275662  ORF Transcript_98431/g.275662 Transcript_98431/m.275662 type:complete len:246 (+) Transcript_98431:281-1018(+)